MKIIKKICYLVLLMSVVDLYATGTVIILNGCSSAGKTSIIKEMQKLYDKPLFHAGFDYFWSMVPDQYVVYGPKAHEGILFIKSCDDNNNQVIDVQKGSLGHQVDYMTSKMITVLVDCGHDVVIDEVIFDDTILNHYTEMFEKYTVYFIGVKCDLHELERREKLRGDRELGLVRGLINRVHTHEKYYDFTVDTTDLSVSTCAQEIINSIQQLPEPVGFKNLQNIYNDIKQGM